MKKDYSDEICVTRPLVGNSMSLFWPQLGNSSKGVVSEDATGKIAKDLKNLSSFSFSRKR